MLSIEKFFENEPVIDVKKMDFTQIISFKKDEDNADQKYPYGYDVYYFIDPTIDNFTNPKCYDITKVYDVDEEKFIQYFFTIDSLSEIYWTAYAVELECNTHEEPSLLFGKTNDDLYFSVENKNVKIWNDNTYEYDKDILRIKIFVSKNKNKLIDFCENEGLFGRQFDGPYGS